MRARCPLIGIASVTLALLVAPAHANAPQPPPRVSSSCAPDRVAPLETCEFCFADYGSPEECFVRNQKRGWERRCVARERHEIYEVWCQPGSPAPPVTVAPPTEPTVTGGSGKSRGCGIAPGGDPSVLLGFGLTLLALSSHRRRARGGAAGLTALIIGTSCGPSEEPPPMATGSPPPPENPSPTRRGVFEEPWAPQAGRVDVLSLRFDLPEGWGVAWPPHQQRWWFGPPGGALLELGLRVDSIRLHSYVEHRYDLRRRLAREGPLTPSEAERFRAFFPGVGRPRSLHRAASYDDEPLPLERAEVRRFGRGRALLAEGRFAQTPLRFAAIITDAETDADADPAVDRVVITWPESEDATQRPNVEHVLRSLEIVPEPRSRSCGRTIIGETDEACDACCGNHWRVSVEECSAVRAELNGGEVRCIHGECHHLCRPVDPQKRAWNQAFERITGVAPRALVEGTRTERPPAL